MDQNKFETAWQVNNKKVNQKKQKKDKDRKNQVNSKQDKTQNRNEEQMQQHRLHQQELSCEANKLREEKEANGDYWREAILLSEVIGPCVAKRRKAQRMGRM